MSCFTGKYIKLSRCGKYFLIKKPYTSWQRFHLHEDTEDTIHHILMKGWVKDEIKYHILDFIEKIHPSNKIQKICHELKNQPQKDSISHHNRVSDISHYGKIKITTINKGMKTRHPILFGYKNWDDPHYKLMVDYGLKYGLYIDNKNIFIYSKKEMKETCFFKDSRELNNSDLIAEHVIKEMEYYKKFISIKIINEGY